MNASVTSPPSTATRPPAPSPSSPQQRDRAPVDACQRGHFERLLSKQSTPADEEAPDGGSAATVAVDASPWGLARPFDAPWRPPFEPEGRGQDDPQAGVETLPSPGADRAATALPRPEIDVPAAVFGTAPAQPSSLYSHLALPLAPPAGEARRFEVFDASSALSHIEVNTLAHGGLSVAVGTPAQHAVLLDRHLAHLQRRLPEKVSLHMRVQESDTKRD